ncbi:MAG: hypothetical protein NC222_07045 [Staphylococcus sp.]|nr:hypothetical protein [Staphylococcus sp.]
MKDILKNIKKKSKKCKHCSKEFIPTSPRQLYCSIECNKIEYNVRRRNKEFFNTDYCLYCGKELINKHTSGRYCPGGICYKMFRRLKRKKKVVKKIIHLKPELKSFNIYFKKINKKWIWEAFKENKKVLSSNEFNTIEECKQDSILAFE